MPAGDDYVADDEIAEDGRRAARLLARFNASPADDPAGRRRILAELLGALGEDAEVRPPLHCDFATRVVRTI